MARGKKRQTTLPGTVEAKNTEVSAAAEAYEEARNSRQEFGREERTLKLKLIEAMKKHTLSEYRDGEAVPPYKVKLSEGSTKVKVIREGGDDDSSDGEE